MRGQAYLAVSEIENAPAQSNRVSFVRSQRISLRSCSHRPQKHSIARVFHPSPKEFLLCLFDCLFVCLYRSSLSSAAAVAVQFLSQLINQLQSTESSTTMSTSPPKRNPAKIGKKKTLKSDTGKLFSTHYNVRTNTHLTLPTFRNLFS